MKKIKYVLALFVGLIMVMSASANNCGKYRIDGNLSDWGLNLNQDWSENSTWLPNPGVYFQVEDNHNPRHANDSTIVGSTTPSGVHIQGVGGSYSFYDEKPVYHRDGYKVSEPYGSPDEKYDIEAIYFDQDTKCIYVAVVMGLKPDGEGDSAPGDLALDIDGDGNYEYGVKLGTKTGLVQFAIYKDIIWAPPKYIPENAPTVILSGTENGTATGAYTSSYVPQDNGYNNYVVELAIPKSSIGNPQTPVSIYDLHLSESCSNEHIPTPEFPIAISIALLLASPAFAYLIIKKRRKE
ncbi:MAG: hypothetical protein DRO95_04000 [Candidatus Altiarchaeales archaeon]|nr:MAG: hypothetical protein DRO95_04000 [Candidatus Altiarchaeales archaeon]